MILQEQEHLSQQAEVEALLIEGLDSGKPWEQLTAIRDLLRTTSGEWTAKQLAVQFKGCTTQNKLDAITENLERLEWFGLVVSEQREGITYWQYADTAKAA